jgi:hypothetical protein
MSENEKSFLVSISSVKKFIKVPLITERNLAIKQEIISKAEEMIDLELQQLSEFVDFSNVLLQKFDKIKIEKGFLSIQHKESEVKCPILKNNKLIERSINDEYVNNSEFTSGFISDLKQISVFDPEYQQEIKRYIDDLVFALYFNIELELFGFENRKAVKEKCSKSSYYMLIEN